MIVRPAAEQDAPGFITLARQVEHWSGPMAGEPGFCAVLEKHIRRATALAAAKEPALLGGLLFSASPPGLSRALARGLRARTRAGHRPCPDN